MSATVVGLQRGTAGEWKPPVLLRGDAHGPFLRCGHVVFLLGTIRNGPGRPLGSSELEAAIWDIWLHGGEGMSRFWGEYALIGLDQSRVVSALTDPSGAISLYWARNNDRLVFSTDAGAVLDDAALRREVDREALAAGLRFPDLRCSATALRGVTELVAGTRLTISSDGTVVNQLHWSGPTASPLRMSHDDGADRLAKAIQSSVQSIGGSGRALLQLSGGLDSSIVAAALVREGIAFDAVALTSDDSESDELRFAGAVARHLGIRLFHRAVSPYLRPLGQTNAPHLPRPTRRLFAAMTDDAVDDLARARGHETIITGGGGDNVFAALAPGVPTGAALRRGLVAEAGRCMVNEARVHRTTVWAVAGKAFDVASSPWRWATDDRFLHPGLRSLAPGRHPWRESAKAMPLARRAHVDLLAVMQNYIDAFAAGGVRRHHPLLAQPVAEACLTAPAAAWIAGGRDRSLARRAFANDLPREILRRRGKGSFQQTAARYLEAQRAAARELLLGGFLASQELLDLASLSNWFASGTLAPDNRILTLVEAELWARHWTT